MRSSYFVSLGLPIIIFESYMLNKTSTDGSNVNIFQISSALRMRKESNTLYTCSVGNLEQKRHTENLGDDGKVILKYWKATY
jgi:hypothetical protein